MPSAKRRSDISATPDPATRKAARTLARRGGGDGVSDGVPDSVPDSVDPTAPYAEYERVVAVYTAAGGQESVQRIVTAISRVGRRLDIYYRQQFIDLNVAPGEWSVLTTLATEGPGGHSTPTYLADVCGVSPSTMTHRLDGMVARDLVARLPDTSNRTRMLVSLTPDGWDLFRRGVIDANVVESNLVTPLDDKERAQLAGLLDKIVAGLKTH